jgi:hypothetical protein
MTRWTLAAASMALAPVTVLLCGPPAYAHTPSGQGLLTGQQPVLCPDLGGPMQIVEPPGLGPSRWTADGQHFVIADITLVTSDGRTFSKTYGVKAGLSTTTCTVTHLEQDGSVTTGTVVFAVLPGS